MITNVAQQEELRRLQILNDYINQSLEAAQRIAPILQARGLWHSPFGVPSGFAGTRAPWASAYAPYTAGVGVSPVASLLHASVPGFVDPFTSGVASMGGIGGLMHTPTLPMDPVTALAAQTAYGYSQPFGYAQPFGYGAQPFVDPWRAEAIRRAVMGL